MNPALSRRVAQIMMTEGVLELRLERHLAFVEGVSSAESFDDLPDWVKDIVLAGERQLAQALARRNSNADPQPTDLDAPRRRR